MLLENYGIANVDTGDRRTQQAVHAAQRNITTWQFVPTSSILVYGVRLRHGGIELEGTHHLGMDDVTNLGKILRRMIGEGCNIEATATRPTAQGIVDFSLGDDRVGGGGRGKRPAGDGGQPSSRGTHYEQWRTLEGGRTSAVGIVSSKNH